MTLMAGQGPVSTSWDIGVYETEHALPDGHGNDYVRALSLLQVAEDRCCRR